MRASNVEVMPFIEDRPPTFRMAPDPLPVGQQLSLTLTRCGTLLIVFAIRVARERRSALAALDEECV